MAGIDTKALHRRSVLLGGAAVLASPLVGNWSNALAADASRLKTDLTPMGAERAASKSGMVPAWTGGVSSMSSGAGPDLFGHEKPIFSITAATIGAHADLIPDGQKEVFKRYPGYRMDVYASHRTACAPQWVYDNIAANLSRGKAVEQGIVNGFRGAIGGAPFPILSDDPAEAGAQAIWNHVTRWQGVYPTTHSNQFVIGNGQKLLSLAETSKFYVRYYDQSLTPAAFDSNPVYVTEYIEDVAPPNQVGAKVMAMFSARHLDTPDKAYEYLVGQGRIRQAPDTDYDIPANQFSDAINYDEIFLWSGALDRYTWKLVGKKEMIVPYNQFAILDATPDEAFETHYFNPDKVRYETHRCLVVEAKLAPGKRHSESFRRFYIDEDTWTILYTESYDHQGNLWKFGLAFNQAVPQLPGNMDIGIGYYNFLSNIYIAQLPCYGASGPIKGEQPSFAPIPKTFFNPQNMANSGGL